MKLGNAISLYFTLLFVGFGFRYCPAWDKALNKLLDNGTLLELKSGIALFEYEAQLYEISLGLASVTSVISLDLMMKQLMEISCVAHRSERWTDCSVW
uniref:hypothetical protein n=1 Tax=Salmonella enterica TaxID=28901 RepID=UPI0004018146|nr:hypothetical protein [Salmonella enterica]